jgi:hypothetical protein
MLDESMNDLFDVLDDQVIEGARMLAQHDLLVVPGSVMRECLNVLHILVCDCESAEEAMLTQALIHRIEAASDLTTGLKKVGAGGAALEVHGTVYFKNNHQYREQLRFPIADGAYELVKIDTPDMTHPLVHVDGESFEGVPDDKAHNAL